jgi:hypothetical protein
LEGRSSSNKVVQQEQVLESPLRILNGFPEVTEDLVPLSRSDFRSEQDLLVAYDSSRGSPKGIDPRTITQSEKQTLPQSPPVKFKRGTVRPDQITRLLELGGDFSKQANANSVRVNQFDEVLNLSRVEIYKVGLHEGIRRWPLRRFKLLKPSGQTFNEADPGNKVTVSVVLKSGH